MTSATPVDAILIMDDSMEDGSTIDKEENAQSASTGTPVVKQVNTFFGFLDVFRVVTKWCFQRFMANFFQFVRVRGHVSLYKHYYIVYE